jgi:hypothetical protein
VDADSCELVSANQFPDTPGNTGNSGKIRVFSRILGSNFGPNSIRNAEIPCSKNREFSLRIREHFPEKQGILDDNRDWLFHQRIGAEAIAPSVI